VTTKTQRQHHIAQLLGKRRITSQPQLLDLLADEGIVATQATVSRDLEDLGAVKVRLPGGELAYAIPEYEPDRLAPHDHLRRVLGEWVAEVAHSGNLVVVRTPPGCAHVVASALDRSGLPGLLGTVAGDDTMMCVASERVGGARLAKTLRGLASLSTAREDDR
jgi:transcriptional regulator of arginine metabolism